ncbi:MAG: tetratricopeptide repeat protein [Calditrichia bacterium]|nr:tetratricopeptide repeat protein [Calditrichia bacterium]
MNKGKKVTTILMMVIMSVSILLTGCSLPEIESAKMYLSQDRYDEAVTIAKTATEKYPKNPEAWYYLGKAYHKKEMINEMVEVFDKCLSLSPTATIKTEITNIKSREFGNSYNDAIKYFNAANKLDDADKQVKMREDVSKKLKIAKICKPDFYMTYILLGKTETQLGRKDAGVKIIEEAAQIFAEKDTVLFNVGNYYLEQNDENKALGYYEKANKINPENSDVVLALSDIYMGKKEFDKAKSYLTILLEKNPDNVNIMFNVAALYYNLKEYNDAVKYFEQVVAIENDNKLFWEYYAQSLFNAEMFEKAASEISQAVEIITDSATLYEILSFAYTRTGDTAKAQEAAEKAKSISGE